MASWYDPKMVRRTGYAIPNSSSNKREHNFRKVLVTPPGAVILTPLVLNFLGGKIFRERLPSPPSGFANSEKVGWHPPFRGDHAAFRRARLDRCDRSHRSHRHGRGAGSNASGYNTARHPLFPAFRRCAAARRSARDMRLTLAMALGFGISRLAPFGGFTVWPWAVGGRPDRE